MAPKVTTSAERSKRKAKQPVRTDKGRNNRASVSEAKVTKSGDKPKGGARVTSSRDDVGLVAPRKPNQPQPTPRAGGRVVVDESPRLSSGRTKGGALATRGGAVPTPRRGSRIQPVNVKDLGNTKSNQVAGGGSRPSLPPGQRGGGLTTKPTGSAPNNKPSAKPTPKSLPSSVTKGLLGPGGAPPKGLIDPVMKRGQPALSGGGKGGRLSMGGVGGALLLAAGGAAADYVGRKSGEAIGTGLRNATNAPKEDKRSNRPGGGSKPKKPSRPASDYEKLFDTQGGRGNYGLDKAPVAPLPASVRKPNSSSSSSSTTSRGSSTQSRSSSSSSSAASSTSSTSSTPSKPGQKWSDFNPNRGTSKTNNPLMKDMIKRMKDREDKEQASKAQQLTDKSRQNSGYSSAEKVDGSKYQEELKKKKGYKFSVE